MQANTTFSLADNDQIKAQTKKWLETVIVGLNFCPFAKKELINDTIYYYVSRQKKLKDALFEVIEQCNFLSNNPHLETSLLIYNEGFNDFNRYLDLVDYANELMSEQGFEGIFQLASFHPNYCFADTDYDDVANYTNRSPFPMLHILREESVERVLTSYKNPEIIPENNINLARQKGADFFESILKRK
jgi:hypothetical protein